MKITLNETILGGSDKQYWHRYLPIYLEEIEKLTNCRHILEFGVYKGDSIRWLCAQFPDAKIYGCDILPVKPEWPKSSNIEYFYVDQGNQESIQNLFKNIDKNLDLIIEDGSHLPKHQKNCLLEGLRYLSNGGLYILEDLHTSHPEHPYYKKSGRNYISALHLLLCLEHIISIGKELDKNLLKEISSKSLFSSDEVEEILNKVLKIRIYKRATLPYKCYSCGESNFNYHRLKCVCGADIYSCSDSITAIITTK